MVLLAISILTYLCLNVVAPAPSTPSTSSKTVKELAPSINATSTLLSNGGSSNDSAQLTIPAFHTLCNFRPTFEPRIPITGAVKQNCYTFADNFLHSSNSQPISRHSRAASLRYGRCGIEVSVLGVEMGKQRGREEFIARVPHRAIGWLMIGILDRCTSQHRDVRDITPPGPSSPPTVPMYNGLSSMRNLDLMVEIEGVSRPGAHPSRRSVQGSHIARIV